MGRRLQRLLQASRDYEGRLAGIEVIINILRFWQLVRTFAQPFAKAVKKQTNTQTHTNKQNRKKNKKRKQPLILLFISSELTRQ